MGALRNFLRHNRSLAIALIAMALAVKALLPAGYMVGSADRVLTVSICADAMGGAYSKQIVVPGKQAEHTAHDKIGQACAYSSLAMAALAGADAVLLAAALAFILLLGFVPAPPLHLRRMPNLRPPLRGPPLTA